MKYCFYCGGELPEYAKYCGLCGKQIPDKLNQASSTDASPTPIIAQPQQAPSLASPAVAPSPSLFKQESIDDFSKIVLAACTTSLIISMLCIGKASSISQIYPSAMRGVKTQQNLLQSQAASLETLLNWSAVVSIVVMILFLFWVNKSYKKLREFYAITDIKFTSGWAVGWFFIPIANIIKPYQVIMELFRKSQPENSKEKFSYGIAVTGVWWFLFFVSSLLGKAAEAQSKKMLSVGIPSAKTVQAFLDSTTAQLISFIFFTFFTAFIVYKISRMLATKRQERKKLNNDALINV